LPRSIICALAALLILTPPAKAWADCPCLTLGADYGEVSRRDNPSVFQWIGTAAVRAPLRGPWMVFARMSYERHEIGCVIEDCWSTAVDVVPLHMGVRLASHAPGSQPFLDLAPTVAWAGVTRGASGPLPTRTDHLLVGVGAGVGISQTTRYLGWEFGVRYGIRASRRGIYYPSPTREMSLSSAISLALTRSPRSSPPAGEPVR
jgi:hypothetical protein